MRVSNLHEAKKVPMVSVLPRYNSWSRGPLTKEPFFILEFETRTQQVQSLRFQFQSIKICP